MMCAATVTAQFVAGKAARDALYLANLPVTSLPAMVIATSVCSIFFALGSAKLLRRVSPAAFVPAAFAVCAVLFLVEWLFVDAAPTLMARLVYLQVSGAGPILGSGFWLIASERFDPRTAKRRFGAITAAGTLGGLVGGLLAERIAAVVGLPAMLPALAVMNGIGAWQIRQLAAPMDVIAAKRRVADAPELSPAPARPGFRALAKLAYLRDLAGLVALGATGAALADYALRAQAANALGGGDTLLRFFAVYYAAISLVTFVVQAAAAKPMLERFGLGVNASTPSVALLGGGLVSIVAPGLESVMAARGAESVCRGSLFRASYEIFYTPMEVSEKRAAKSIIDVGFDRVGDAAGALGVWLVLLLVPAVIQVPAIMWLAVITSAVAVFLTTRLSRDYVATLERSLLKQGVDVDAMEILDTTTRTTMLRTMTDLRRPSATRYAEAVDSGSARRATDAEILQIEAIRSRDRERILGVLHGNKDLTATLIPHVIPLLAWDAIANDAVDALKRVAEEHIGALTDALIDPNQDFAVRRRLARAFSVCVSQRAVDGLLLGLDDVRFEVRFHCARSLALVMEKNPRVRIDSERVFDVVLAEVEVGRPVWEGHRLLREIEAQDEGRFFADEFLKERASRSLAHVFTLLSLVLAFEPLQAAYRMLHTDDDKIRGTALDYLDSVLPKPIREGLWPYLEEQRRPRASGSRPREEILADLMRSNQSIAISLKALRKKAGGKP
jgi:ATP:ADP antiporter, AAA family